MKNRVFALVFLLSLIFPVYSQKKQTAIDLINLAKKEQSYENWHSASQYYLEVININPAFTEAWYGLSICTYRLGEFELSMKYLNEAERLDSQNAEIQNLKGMIYLASGQVNDAREIFENILKKYPNNVDAHFGLAEIEIFQGKFSGAERQYSEALKRQSLNRKALLSLAVVCQELGKFDLVETYLKQAMQTYSGESEVHYLASVIYMLQGDFKLSEQHARIAVEIDANYEKAYELLSTDLFYQKRYYDVIDLCDFLISRNKQNCVAWYLKGIANNNLGQVKEAIEAWNNGLFYEAEDEIMRFQLELCLTGLKEKDEDLMKLQKELSNYHFIKAKQFEDRYERSSAIYEYERALAVWPENVKARLNYANILELESYHELYLNELLFIKNNTDYVLSKDLEYTIESYKSLLNKTLANKWNVKTEKLDKTRWNIAVFYYSNNSSFIHADINQLASLSCAEIFKGEDITCVKTQVSPVKNFSEAFQNARLNGFDYFIILSANEGSDEISLIANIFSGKTGTKVQDFNFYSSGNERFSNVLRRLKASVLSSLVVRGKIIGRNGNTALIDLGRAENIVKDAEFKIIKKGALKLSEDGQGLTYKESDLYGSLVVTEAGEAISEAKIINHGFYDRINVNDELILVKLPEPTAEGENPIDNVPLADEKGNSTTTGKDIVDEIRKAVEHPAVLELLRNIF